MRRNRLWGNTLDSNLECGFWAECPPARNGFRGVQAAPATGTAANVTSQRLLHANSEPSQWMTYGGDYNEQRYSRLRRSHPTTSGSSG